MHEGDPPVAGEDLALQALLYASGELEGDALAAFEQRLAEDQEARDALCQAVEMSLALDANAPQGPEPGYRTRVRHRLRQRRRRRQGSESSPSVFHHPAFWSILGAIFAMIVFLLLFAAFSDLDAPKPTSKPTTQEKRP